MAPRSEILGLEKIVDRDGSLDRLGGDEALYKEICEVFISDSGNIVTQLKTGLNSRNQDELVRALHSLKGASANIGAEKLSRISGDLELVAKKGDFDEVGSKVSVLEKSLAELLGELHKQKEDSKSD